MHIKIPQSLQQIANTIQSPLYIVGGYIRNYIAGLGCTDIDLTGPLPANQLILPYKCFCKVVQPKLGTAIIYIDGDAYEYTPFRIEHYTDGNHTPDKVEFVDDIRLDCDRRDFACNAIYYDLKSNKFIDLYNGCYDCKSGILRAINQSVFVVDGLRILRMVRIAAETGFVVDLTTVTLSKDKLSLLHDISSERKRMELDKIIKADTKYNVQYAHYYGLCKLIEFGILPYISNGFGNISIDNIEYIKECDIKIRLILLLYFADNPKMVLDDLKYSNGIKHDILSTIDAYKKYSTVLSYLEIRKYCVYYNKFLKNIIDMSLALGQIENACMIQKILLELKEDNTPINISQLSIKGNDILSFISPQKIGQILDRLLDDCIENPTLNNREKLLAMALEYSKLI
ncbi:MAG: hypothetical protein FWF56_05665 [Firmicutes bacterium]|nr:hypothetical protein [Bacillota bacterium]